ARSGCWVRLLAVSAHPARTAGIHPPSCRSCPPAGPPLQFLPLRGLLAREMAHFTSDGLQLAYDEFGPRDARKAIVLLHGCSANRYENFKRMGWYDAVAGKGLRGLAFDHRGHGESAKPHEPEKYSREAMAKDVFALMDHAGVERAHLLGF